MVGAFPGRHLRIADRPGQVQSLRIPLRSPLRRRNRALRVDDAHDCRRQGHDSRGGWRRRGVHRRRSFRVAQAIPLGRCRSRRGNRDHFPEPWQLRQDASLGRQDEVDVRLDAEPRPPLLLSSGLAATCCDQPNSGRERAEWTSVAERAIQSNRPPLPHNPAFPGGADFTDPRPSWPPGTWPQAGRPRRHAGRPPRSPAEHAQ